MRASTDSQGLFLSSEKNPRLRESLSWPFCWLSGTLPSSQKMPRVHERLIWPSNPLTFLSINSKVHVSFKKPLKPFPFIRKKKFQGSVEASKPLAFLKKISRVREILIWLRIFFIHNKKLQGAIRAKVDPKSPFPFSEKFQGSERGQIYPQGFFLSSEKIETVREGLN